MISIFNATKVHIQSFFSTRLLNNSKNVLVFFSRKIFNQVKNLKFI